MGSAGVRLIIVLALASVLVGCITPNRGTVSNRELSMLDALEDEEDESRPEAWLGGSYSPNAFKYLMGVYVRHGEPEWYCSCAIPEDTGRGGKALDLNTCDLGYFEEQSQGSTLSWEHVVPQSWLDEARTSESQKDLAKGDPYNLVPAAMPLNRQRWNNPFWEIEGEHNVWTTSGGTFEGDCDFELVKIEGVTWIEPPNQYKGDLARITLYMHERYGFRPVKGPSTQAYLELMRWWAEIDPMSDEEQQRLEAIQGMVDWTESPADF